MGVVPPPEDRMGESSGNAHVCTYLCVFMCAHTDMSPTHTHAHTSHNKIPAARGIEAWCVGVVPPTEERIGESSGDARGGSGELGMILIGGGRCCARTGRPL